LLAISKRQKRRGFAPGAPLISLFETWGTPRETNLMFSGKNG